LKEQAHINYTRIAEAIEFMKLNFRSQPCLEEIAEKVNVSQFHFQRLFTDWAGVSPKQFLQYISIEYAKSVLQTRQASLFDVAYETGLSGTGRLHDLFIKIEGMTPGEYKNGGAGLSINYSFADSPFGNVLIASTLLGICYMAFIDNIEEAISDLQHCFPKATFIERADANQENALNIFNSNNVELKEIKLHLKGSPFQLKVWQALLKIPMSHLSTYGTIAKEIDMPNASRAVGTAIGSNPVAFLIPCHRVIQSSGISGGYMWGTTRKTAMIGWEAARAFSIHRL
jgi:AraC family transcriptional regulator of adaptative response/methylated-DNA-[protein]-cysteine methyltransferase